jgi:glutamate formiminotransferase
MAAGLLECVINISEGRDHQVVAAVAAAGGTAVLDVHSDPHHHRSVLTLAGNPHAVAEAARSVARSTVSLVDLRGHEGVHPRFGSLDVVPWVSLDGWPVEDGDEGRAVDARDTFARWAAAELGLPCFLYGPERSLPEVRRSAWRSLAPDFGPDRPHPSAGSSAVGARPVLVAYNLWLAKADLDLARRLASDLRGPRLRALGLRVGDAVQVSFNLVDPWKLGPGAVHDAVAARTAVKRAELVGLVPASVLSREPSRRWAELGLDSSATIEARLEQAGLDGGRFS